MKRQNIYHADKFGGKTFASRMEIVSGRLIHQRRARGWMMKTAERVSKKVPEKTLLQSWP